MKYYLSLRSVEILPTKICVPNPVFTFAPATKMTTDAVWNGGMGTLAYTWRGGKEKEEMCGMAQRATGKV
ncbi:MULTISPECIES: hypothetical protein [Bacteroidales]|uniref:hypothetical protein n=1 Tax=Bacteroidales TaxID=171549 RepID=UPI0011210AA0|nr:MULTISPECIES: hypothetical protein [Bacteroidales]MDC1816531.1 hypothetical protein [Bacteroides uniformis]MDR3821763.1 hypothetical protein [Bacteroides sp.]